LHGSPLVREAGHNISPGLRKQLVLELERWVRSSEVLATSKVATTSGSGKPRHWIRTRHSPRRWHNAAILSRREGTRRSWRVAAVLLKEADVEDIMQTGVFQELQTIRHTSNAPEHPERPGPTRLELVPGTGVEHPERPGPTRPEFSVDNETV